MKKLLLFCIIFILSNCTKKDQPVQNPLRVVELQGTAYNRGLIHGKTLKEEIKQIITQWSNMTELKHKMKMEDIKKDFLNRTNYIEAIKKWTPDLIDEIKGIADGSGIDYELILLLQISEELENYIPSYTMFKCTSIGVNKTENSPTYIAQNMEPPRYLQGFPTLLHIKHDNFDLETYVFTFPGFIGLNGLNSKAVGITGNGLPDYHYKNKGLPVSFVVRGILEKTTLKDAIDFIYNIEHAKAQNYIIGGREKATCFECDSEEIFIFSDEENPNLTYHTNHYLVADYESKYCSRLKTLKEELVKRNFKIGYEDIKAILSSRKYNAGRPISHYNTYGCTIMILSDNPELHIAPGRPDKNQFLIYKFVN